MTGSGKKYDGSLIAGLVMILIGSFFLFERFIPSINFSDFWPLLLVLIGIIMIFRGFPLIKKEEKSEVLKEESNISPDDTEKDNSTNNDINL